MSSKCPVCGMSLRFGNLEPIRDPLSPIREVEEIDEGTLRLAQLVADMDPPPTDKKSIEKWAKRLAEDISKGRD